MTAQEMFEQLGYIKNESICYNNEHIVYEKPLLNGTDIFIVEFYIGAVIYTNTAYHCLRMHSSLLKAINKQFEELGWLDER